MQSGSWRTGNRQEELKDSLETIRMAADQIITGMEQYLKLEKTERKGRRIDAAVQDTARHTVATSQKKGRI